MKKKLAKLLVLTMVLGFVLTGCGGGDEEKAKGDAAEGDKLVYAVEAGSAGEAAAKENDFEFNAVNSQADALMEVASGTSDAAIIDLLMAGAMIGEGTSYPDMIHTDELTTEEYGVGCRKDSDMVGLVNKVLADAYADGTMKEIAAKYGVQDAVMEQGEAEDYKQAEKDSDIAYIKEKGTLIVGCTDFNPMDFKDKSGEWVGFDADMARLVGEELGVEVQFVELDWDNKIMEIQSKNVDLLWNGMTLTPEVTEALSCTNPYCKNAQVIVIPKED